MKKTEQRWQHIETGRVRDAGFKPCDETIENYRLVTVTYSEPEWEEVEVVRWVLIFKDGVEFTYKDKQDLDIEVINCQRHGGYTPTVVELKNTYRRKPEVEEVWEGEVVNGGIRHGNIPFVPEKWIGKKVRVEVVP